MNTVVLSLHYLPSVEWFAAFLSADTVIIDVHEHYVKQTYRNRCHILSANGRLALTIPVKKAHTKEPMHLLTLENEFPWQQQHWDAICSGYNSSPFLFYYKDYFEPLFHTPFNSLVEWNLALLDRTLKLLKIEKTFALSTSYVSNPAYLDFRNTIHPKKQSELNYPHYLQVFSAKYPFHPNLSIMDVLCNEGNKAQQYLLKVVQNASLKSDSEC